MKKTIMRTRWCTFAGAAVMLCWASTASAQFAGFNVRFINVTSEQVNNHTEALQMVGDPRTTPKAFSASFDGSDNFPTVNFAGGNNFGGDHPFPGGAGPGNNFDDFILYATATVTVPDGDWAIGFGSDDGGQLTLAGSGLACVEGCGDGGELPFESGDMIHFNGNRGHNWTIGEILDGGGTYEFNASVHERGGGDSLEVAIIPLDDWSGAGFDVAEGWQLLGDGVYDWKVTTDKTGQIAVAGDTLGEFFPAANSVAEVRAPNVDDTYAPGLAQEWSRSGNGGSRDQLIVDRFGAGVAPAAFRADDSDWWSGSAAFGDLPKYPAQTAEDGFDVEGNNDQYSVRLTGELKFDADGTYRFRDGVDDYTYFALDLDRNGVAGDGEGEVLINDNTWVGVDGVRNSTEGDNPSPLVEVDIDVSDEANGDWIAMEFMMAEGGGGDSATLFWNGTDLENEIIADPITVMDDPSLLVPQSHTRSKLPGEVTELQQTATIGGGPEYTMQVSSDLLDSDHIVFFDGTLDVTGLTINVEADGDLVEGDSWVLLVGSDVVGMDSVTYNVADPSAWDLSQAGTTGRITYTGAAAAVPEPSTALLLGFGGLLLGLVRRRRQ